MQQSQSSSSFVLVQEEQKAIFRVDSQSDSNQEVALINNRPLLEIASHLSDRWREVPEFRKEAVYRNKLLQERSALLEQLEKVTAERDELLKRNRTIIVDEQKKREEWQEDFESELSFLTDKINTLLREDEIAGNADGDADTRRAKFKQYILLALQSLRNMKKERDDFQQKLENSERRLQAEAARSRELQDGIAELRVVLDALQAQHGAINEDEFKIRENHQAEVEALQEHINKLEKNMKATERKRAALEQQLRQLEAMKAAGTMSSSVMSQMESLLQDMQALLATLNVSLKVNNSTMQEQKQQAQTLELTIISHIEIIKHQISMLVRQHQQFQDALNEAEQRLREAAADSEEAARVADQCKQLNQQLMATQNELKAKEDEWRLQSAKLEQNRAYLSKRLEEMSKAMTVTLEQVEALESQCAALVAEIARLKQLAGEHSDSQRERPEMVDQDTNTKLQLIKHQLSDQEINALLAGDKKRPKTAGERPPWNSSVRV